MKTALLHYWLTNMRGGENVLEEFCRIWPDADIFTHAYAPDNISDIINAHRVNCTFINRLPGAGTDCQKYLPLMPPALKRLDFSAYDLIISSESGPVKGIRKPKGSKHICYCHSPMRYLWDMYDDYYRNAGLAGKIAMSLFKRPLRRYDLKSAETVDRFIANSHFVAERIKRIYGRASTVIHPPVNVDFYAQGDYVKSDYYLFVGQLIPYKRPDLALAACKRMNRKLIIVGNGSMRGELEKNAGHNVTFTGKMQREKLRALYAGAKALIFPGIEDFGIVPLEAQASGTPVIALKAGGALETIVADMTGIFFDQPDVECLCNAIEAFEIKKFPADYMAEHAKKFSAERFRSEINHFFYP
jgi:glycosyltransferase involved in cell wall biosynthesis